MQFDHATLTPYRFVFEKLCLSVKDVRSPEGVNAPIRNPHLADIDAGTVVDDFLQDVLRRIMMVDMQIAARCPGVDQQCVKLKAFAKHADRQVQRNTTPGRRQPEGSCCIDARISIATLITALRWVYS